MACSQLLHWVCKHMPLGITVQHACKEQEMRVVGWGTGFGCVKGVHAGAHVYVCRGL